jgi:hypothetical protein
MKPTENLELIPTKHSHLFRVKLNLEFQSRFIGTLDTSSKGKFITERKERHLFRKTNSLGLNQALLTSPEIDFKFIVIDYNGKKLVTTRLYFITHSKVFIFKEYERQVFLALDDFGLDKAEEFERKINNQIDLFGEAA